MSDILYDKALDAINDLYNDRSASLEECLENLRGLGDEIETLIECIQTDIENRR